MLASKREANLIYKGRTVFQFFPLDFVVEMHRGPCDAPGMRIRASFLSFAMGAVLPLESVGIPLTVDKQFVVEKLTSFACTSEAPFFGSRSEKAQEFIASEIKKWDWIRGPTPLGLRGGFEYDRLRIFRVDNRRVS